MPMGRAWTSISIQQYTKDKLDRLKEALGFGSYNDVILFLIEWFGDSMRMEMKKQMVLRTGVLRAKAELMEEQRQLYREMLSKLYMIRGDEQEEDQGG